MYNTNYNIKVYNKEDLVCKIEVKGNTVNFKNYTTDILSRLFGVLESATIDDLEDFFEDSCFPKERVNCKSILNRLGLDCYEPELICRKTHGLQFDDFIWLQFSDEPQVCWNDIKLRD